MRALLQQLRPASGDRSPRRRLPRGGVMLATGLVAICVMASRTVDIAREWPTIAPEIAVPFAWLVGTASAEPRPATGAVPTVRQAGGSRPDSALEHQPRTAAAPIDPASYGVLEDIAADLKTRQEQMEAREAALAQREAAVDAVEARTEEQLKRLAAYKSELTALADRITRQDQAQITQLVKVYEAMKPINAAEVFDGLDLEVLLPLVKAMNGQRLARIVAAMDPGKAQAITVELARIEPMPVLKE